MPRIVHFEIPAENPERSMAFYGEVFGWKFQHWAGPMDYWLIQTGQDGPGIDGGLMARHDPAQPVVSVIDVDSVDAYCEKIAAAGGQVVVPKMTVPGVGYLAYFKDLDGHIFGLHQHDPSAA